MTYTLKHRRVVIHCTVRRNHSWVEVDGRMIFCRLCHVRFYEATRG